MRQIVAVLSSDKYDSVFRPLLGAIVSGWRIWRICLRFVCPHHQVKIDLSKATSGPNLTQPDHIKTSRTSRWQFFWNGAPTKLEN